MTAVQYDGALRGEAGAVANEVARRVYEQLEDDETLTTLGGLLADYMSACEGVVLGWIDPSPPVHPEFGDTSSHRLADIHQAIAEYLFACTKAYLARPDVAERLSELPVA